MCIRDSKCVSQVAAFDSACETKGDWVQVWCRVAAQAGRSDACLLMQLLRSSQLSAHWHVAA
eukprot:9653869-Alexandrium_andersonii.AAC.1